MTKPGLCPVSEINFPKYGMYPHLISFMGDIKSPIADVGELNHKSQYLSTYYGVMIDQIEGDFDYYLANGKKYETILMFEVLSHLVNPLWFLAEIKFQLEKGGVIYLSMPSRPKVLWNKHHYCEISTDRFKRFILDELGLKIVRMKRIRNPRQPDKLRIGIRPVIRWVLRLLYNYTVIYEIRRIND